MILAQADFDPTTTDEQGSTVLYHAARKNNHVAVQLLLQHPKTNPNALTLTGASPLYIAAEKNNVQAFRMLVEHPTINVNTQLDQSGATPLYIAAASGHTEIVRILASVPKVKFNSTCAGQTPAAAARTNGHQECADLLSTASQQRSAAAIEMGRPIPFDAQPLNLGTIKTSDDAAQAVKAWLESEVPESDLRQLRRDIRAYTLLAQMMPEEINTRYQHFFTPAIAIQETELRRNVAKLLQVLPT